MNRPASLATLAALGLAALAGCAGPSPTPGPSAASTAPNPATSSPVSSASTPAGPSPSSPGEGPQATVLSTTDGDTFRVWVAGKEETVRVLAIDTPETRKPGTPVQCGGPEASEEAHRLLDRTTVSLAPDPTQDDRDRYGRLLRYVTLADGTTDFGLHMVQGGWAHAYRLSSGKAPQRYDQYRTAELSAKASHTGPLATC